MKLIITLIVGLLGGAAIVIGGYFFLTSSELGDETLTVSFTEAEIQEKIGKDFPKKERIPFVIPIPIVIEEPIVKFLGDSNRVQLSVVANIAIPFIRTEEVIGTFTSSIRYEKEDKTLRIDDLIVESLEIQSMPKQYQKIVQTALTIAARKYLDDHIVHTLDPKDYKGKMAEMFIQKIKVKDGRLEVILGL